MKIFTPIGSKERFVEMMERVNKIKLNEDFMNAPQEQQGSSDMAMLEHSFNELKTGMLKIKRSNTQTSGAETYLELICFSQQGADTVFRFKIETSEGDQDGVMSVNDAELVSLTSDSINIPEGSTDLQQFNAQHKAEMIDVVSEYADFDTPQPELDEEYLKAVEKIESYPFTSKPRTMVTSRQYGDEKPTNPALRVKSPLLDKFVDENVEAGTDNSEGSHGEIIRKAIEFIDNKLKAKGLSSKAISHDEYVGLVKDATLMFYHSNASGNDFLGEAKKKKKPTTSDYPDQIGSHFKPKSDYPVEKKKPTKVVAIDEEEMTDDRVSDMGTGAKLNIGDVVSVEGLFGDYQVGVRHSEGKPFLMPFDTVSKKANPEHRIYLTSLNNPKLTKVLSYSETNGGFMSEGVSEPEVEKIEQDHEETGEQLHGGLGDDKSTQEFDQEQVLMGLGVEMEHSDDPTVALEIVLDHLSEDPEYYTTKEDPEASAQANASKDASKDVPHASGAYTQDGMAGELDRNGHPIPAIEPDFGKMGYGGEDKEEEDILLGFKPLNVGDEIEEAYGQANPLKIPPFPKAGTVR